MPLRGLSGPVQRGLRFDAAPRDLLRLALRFGQRGLGLGPALQLDPQLAGLRFMGDALPVEMVEQRAAASSTGAPELVDAQDGVEALAAQVRLVQEIRG